MEDIINGRNKGLSEEFGIYIHSFENDFKILSEHLFFKYHWLYFKMNKSEHLEEFCFDIEDMLSNNKILYSGSGDVKRIFLENCFSTSESEYLFEVPIQIRSEIYNICFESKRENIEKRCKGIFEELVKILKKYETK